MSKSNTNINTSRIRVLSFFILFFAVVIIIRLYFLQIISNEHFLLKADKQYVNTSNAVFSRGNIFFQNKDGSLVGAGTLKSGFTISINPSILKDKELAYEKINEIIPLDKNLFLEKASKTNDPYEEIARRVDYNLGKKIESLGIKGVGVYLERWRFYPAQSLASNTIGFLAFKGNDFAGRYGLERYYEDVLKREKGSNINFFAQIFSNIKEGNGFTNEGDIVISIEPTVQSNFENELKETNKKYNSEYTAGIIINPKNGEILSMAISPSFDLNNTKEVENVNFFSNLLVENVYEMGSIIKPLTVSTGLDLGLITASTTYYDPGFVYINNKKISNFDGKERGVVDIQTALSQSLNVGMTEIVKKV
jgi:cell division protein FtsI/penicillin-binding protein 2